MKSAKALVGVIVLVFCGFVVSGSVRAFKAGDTKWKYPLKSSSVFSPAVGHDATVYVPSQSHLLALYPDGSLKWDFDAGGLVNTPSVDSKNNIYFQSLSKGIYALDSNKNVLWNYNPTGWQFGGRIAISVDGTIYTTNGGRELHAIDSTNGNQKWVAQDENRGWLGTPAISTDGRIYSAGNYYLYELNKVDGSIIMRSSESNLLLYCKPPSIGSNGDIYIAVGSLGQITAFHANGSKAWQQSISPYSQFEQVVTGSDGTIYFITSYEDFKYYFLNAMKPDQSDIKTWGIPSQRYLYSYIDSAIGNDGNIYLSGYEGVLAVSSTGTQLWQSDLYITSSPVIGQDGTLYVIGAEGNILFEEFEGHYIYAIYTSSTGAAQSSWSMMGGNAQHTHSAFGSSTLNDGLVAYYPFNGNADDESGNGNHGIIASSYVTFVPDGVSGGAAKFTKGSDSGITIPDSDSLDLGGKGITVAAWVSLDACGDETILSKSDSNTNEPYVFWSCFRGSGMGAWFDGGSNGDLSNYQPPISRWTHLAMTYDGIPQGTISFFVDGNLVMSMKSNANGIVSNTSNMHIGASPCPCPEDFSGLMDEVRLYNRALSEAEIQELYGQEIKEYNLTVTLNSTAVGTVTGSGIACGFDCSESYPAGTQVTLTAKPKSGWKFAYWDDGEKCVSGKELTVTMDAKKEIVAKFLPSNGKIAVKPYSDSPLGDRTPLILVHGNSGESDNNGYYGWNKYINKSKKDTNFSNKFKLYTYRWNSNWSNLNNGIAMGVLIDSLYELLDKEIVILAHSRGGLVSRYYMNRYSADSGKYRGQQAGEKVRRLVTLATPHRGSPLADDKWNVFSFDYNHFDPVAMGLCGVNWADRLFGKGYEYLRWDDWDTELTNKKICWDSACHVGENYCSYLESNNTDILGLNQNESFHEKIFAVGGNRFDRQSIQPSVISKIIFGPIAWIKLAWKYKHTGLAELSKLLAEMPIIPNNYTKKNPHIDHLYRPFEANDGMVPLISALFLKAGSGRVFEVDEDGKLVYDNEKVKELCLVGTYGIVDGTVDHLSFLDDSDIIKEVIRILKGL